MADAWLAAIRLLIRLGIAIAAIIKMIATTIRSSIRENPSSWRGIDLIPSPRHTRGIHWHLKALHTWPHSLARFMPGRPRFAQTSRPENKELTVLLATNLRRDRRAVRALWTKIVRQDSIRAVFKPR
jgi:hypothetical protein